MSTSNEPKVKLASREKVLEKIKNFQEMMSAHYKVVDYEAYKARKIADRVAAGERRESLGIPDEEVNPSYMFNDQIDFRGNLSKYTVKYGVVTVDSTDDRIDFIKGVDGKLLASVTKNGMIYFYPFVSKYDPDDVVDCVPYYTDSDTMFESISNTIKSTAKTNLAQTLVQILNFADIAEFIHLLKDSKIIIKEGNELSSDAIDGAAKIKHEVELNNNSSPADFLRRQDVLKLIAVITNMFDLDKAEQENTLRTLASYDIEEFEEMGAGVLGGYALALDKEQKAKEEEEAQRTAVLEAAVKEVEKLAMLAQIDEVIAEVDKVIEPTKVVDLNMWGRQMGNTSNVLTENEKDSEENSGPGIELELMQLELLIWRHMPTENKQEAIDLLNRINASIK